MVKDGDSNLGPLACLRLGTGSSALNRVQDVFESWSFNSLSFSNAPPNSSQMLKLLLRNALTRSANCHCRYIHLRRMIAETQGEYVGLPTCPFNQLARDRFNPRIDSSTKSISECGS